MEQIDLTTPETFPSVTNYKVDGFTIRRTAKVITIDLLGSNGEHKGFSYNGAQAVTLMNALNTSNNSVTSLEKRILQRLVADGHLAGAISGSPD
jgi:hypothetical protein